MHIQIEVLDDECIQAIDSKQVGVGQLFRYLRALPSFTLMHASREKRPQQQRPHTDSNSINDSSGNSSDGGSDNGSKSVSYLSRHYKLECPQVKCEFVETFEPDFLDLITTNTTNTTAVHV